MRLTRLWLTDFRCYREVEIAPADRLTAVLGPNGSGKTSLLEAVVWLAEARSFRGAPGDALVRDGSDRAIVRGEIERSGRQKLVEAEIARSGPNRIQVNRQRVPRSRALGESLRVSVFSPDDLELVKGGPGRRRAYLDDLLASASPRLRAAVGEYERVVRQRTALLRSGVRDDADRSTLEVWDDQLAHRGAEVVRARLRLLERLTGPLAGAYADVAGGPEPGPAAADVSTSYEPDWTGAPLDPGAATEPDGLVEALRRAVEDRRTRELERGQTLVGPHRDEWRLSIAGLDARSRASQGEQRSLALALRVAGHELLTEVVGEPPLLLLDDVFSELDPARSEALVGHLPPGQALVTTASTLPPELPVDRRLHVSGGSVDA